MYFQSAYDTSKKWHTILLVPYGRGGAGFSVLDVTDPKKPLHLYSILNDHVKHKVHVMDHNGSLTNYDYVATSYPISTLVEAVVVTDNDQDPKGDEKCTNTKDHQCFHSKIVLNYVFMNFFNQPRVIR